MCLLVCVFVFVVGFIKIVQLSFKMVSELEHKQGHLYPLQTHYSEDQDSTAVDCSTVVKTVR